MEYDEEMWKLAENIIVEMVGEGKSQEEITDKVLKTTHSMVSKDDIIREIGKLKHNDQEG